MKTHTAKRGHGLVRWAAAAGAAIASAAGGQAQPDAPAPALDPAEFAARSITRLALLDVRLTTTPTPGDYRVASILLGLAQDLAPNDQEILRRRLEATWASGDTELALRLSEAILRLDPKDTVTLLRLVTARIAQAQTVDDRLALYDRFLDTRGDGRYLDASVRSRLALDAALLLRDRGDEPAYVERLIQSTQLDPSHKEAASLAVNYAWDRVGMAERLDLLANLLLADPVDPNVHETVARQLAIGGAYTGAKRFLETARIIRSTAGQPVTSVEQSLRILRWHSEGPEAVVSEINRTVLELKDEAARRIRDLQRDGLPTDKARRPEEIRISPEFGLVLAVAFDAQGDRPAVESAINELALTVGSLVTALLDQNLRPADVAQDQAERRAGELLAVLQLARLWTGVQTDAAAPAFADPNSPLVRSAPPELPVLQAWLALRQGRAAEAARALEEPAASNVLARVAFAQACEQLGDVPGALEQYDRVVRDAPLEVSGAWARARLARLGVTISPAEVERLERWARPDKGGGVPGWVDETARSPRLFVSLDAALDRTSQEAVDRTTLRLRVTNISSVPMALGPDRTISSRLLLAPKLDLPLGPLAALARPEVADFDRRLRLMPRESLEVAVWPDPGETGLLLEMLAIESVRVRWRVIQGFWLSPGGGYEAGPLSVTTETQSLVRNALPEATLAPQELARKVTADPEQLLPRAASALRTALFMSGRPGRDRGADEGHVQAVRELAAAWTARWPALSPTAKAMVVAVVPGRVFGEPFGALDDLMKADADPAVQCLVLATRVTDPGDEYLARMERSPDPRVAELSRLITERLRTDTPCYARLSPDRLWPAPATGAK